MENTQLAGSASQKLDRQRQSHQVQAEKLYKEGVDTYQTFISKNCEDTALFSQALSLFCKSIEFDRQFADPYIALGHAHLLIEDQVMAQQYFRAVLEFEPEHSIAKDAMVILSEGPLDFSQDFFLEGSEFSERYELLKKRIFTHKKDLSLRLHRPTLDMSQLYLVEDYMDELETFYEQTSTEVLLLENEMDTTELSQLLVPFQEIISQQEQIILQSYDLMDIGDNLNLLKNQSQSLLEQEPAEIQKVLPDLQKAQAVQRKHMNYLNEEGYDTLELEQIFEQWVLFLENLQDIVDDEI